MCFTDTKESKNGCLHNGLFLAVKEATDIEKDKFSGIIGLGPKSDVGRMPSFIEQVAGLGGVGGEDEIAPVFSIFLSNKDSAPGAISFGGYDLEKYAKAGKGESDIFWAQMAHAQTYFWVMNMGQI